MFWNPIKVGFHHTGNKISNRCLEISWNKTAESYTDQQLLI